MSIRPVFFNGMIQRADDVGQVKVHEDQKPVTDQQAIQGQVTQKEEQAAHEVIESQEGAQTQNQADAREEGKNKYVSVRRKKKDQGGRVIKKAKNEGGGFDFKI